MAKTNERVRITNQIDIQNRDTYAAFVPSPIERYRTKVKIKSVRFKRNSPDRKYEELRKAGLNIDITNPEIFGPGGRKPMDGIFSPLFGADTTHDAPIYTCDCHELTGATNKGKICKKCGSEVRTIDADLRITGHIDIAPFHILTYHGYNEFSKLFRPQKMNEIITTSRRITRSGKIAKDDNALPTIMELYEDYDTKYKDKIGYPKDIMFMSKIPVYSSRLRPLMQDGMQISILDVNKKLFSLVRMRGVLVVARHMPRLKRSLEVQKALNQLQQDFNDVCKIINEQLNTKNGVFRKALTSGRLDNSSRLVITLGDDLMAHEIDVPYQTMMVQYEEEIANYISRIQDIPIGKAIAMVEEHVTEPDPFYVQIINQMLKTGKGVWALVNRNPTISEGGIIYCRIRRIHEDTSDLTLHLPVDVLNALAADFDGDQVTMVSVRNPKYHPLFITMCPTYAFIDRADGHFSRAMDFKKDYAAILSYAWDIDVAYDNYLTHPDEDSTEMLKALGLDEDTNREAEEDRTRILHMLAESDVPKKIKERYLDPFGAFRMKKRKE